MKDVFVHPQALCESNTIGEGTRVWAFAHVLSGAQIGRNCNICDGVFIENDVVVGNNVTVKCGVQLWDGVCLADNVFVGPNVTFSNDLFPRSKQKPANFSKTIVEEGASIGANATILPGIRIGANAMVGAGSVVTRDLPACVVAAGNPAAVIGYARASEIDLAVPNSWISDFPVRPIVLGQNLDSRGRLCVLDHPALPFAPQRIFMVDKVAAGLSRGSHAHRSCEQLFIAATGRMRVAFDDGSKVISVGLGQGMALYVPALVWSMQYGHSSDAVLLVLTSQSYDPADYVSDYLEFRELAQGRRTNSSTSDHVHLEC